LQSLWEGWLSRRVVVSSDLLSCFRFFFFQRLVFADGGVSSSVGQCCFAGVQAGRALSVGLRPFRAFPGRMTGARFALFLREERPCGSVPSPGPALASREVFGAFGEASGAYEEGWWSPSPLLSFPAG
jgi:hypothetical protein